MISNQLRDALAAPRVREFVFGNEDFEALRKLVKELTGINLSEQKREFSVSEANPRFLEPEQD